MKFFPAVVALFQLAVSSLLMGVIIIVLLPIILPIIAIDGAVRLFKRATMRVREAK